MVHTDDLERVEKKYDDLKADYDTTMAELTEM